MSRRRVEAGLSLIELTIAVSILGLVMAAVTTTLVVALRATSEATDRLDRDNDVLFTSAHFGPDVAGAEHVSAPDQPGLTGSRAAPGCGPTQDRLVVELRGLAALGVDTDEPWIVSYVLTDAGSTITRRRCAGTSGVPSSDLVVVAGLASTTPPTARCLSDVGAAVACEDRRARLVTLRLTGDDGTVRSASGTRRIT